MDRIAVKTNCVHCVHCVQHWRGKKMKATIQRLSAHIIDQARTIAGDVEALADAGGSGGAAGRM